MIDPKVSVLIVVCNESNHIERLLKSLLSQSYENYEIVIVDDGSQDSTLEIIRQHLINEKIIIVENKTNQGIAESRNIAWSKATGEFVLFIDGDCIATKNLIREHVSRYTDDVFGVEGVTYYENCITSASSHVTQVLKPGQYQTCNISYRSKVWHRVGGFDKNLLNYGEDIDFARRVIEVCGEIAFSEDCVVIHQQKKERFQNYFKKTRDRARAVHYQLSRNPGIHIAQPINILVMVCPLIMILYHRILSIEDLKALGYKYLALFVQRWTFWRLSSKTKNIII